MKDSGNTSLAHLNELLAKIAGQPSADDLWKLRGVVLACGKDHPQIQQITKIAHEFFLYLCEIESKMTARQYNELASRLDIGAVGLLALQDILVERENLWKSLLLGGTGEGLMVFASRQYVKAWQQELNSVHRRAAWRVYEMLWQLSLQHQPDMDATERQALIEKTLTPAIDDDVPFDTRMILLLRIFQTVLLLTAASANNWHES